jgi:hypothetical protein
VLSERRCWLRAVGRECYARRVDGKPHGTIVRVVGETQRRSPTSLALRACSEDEQGWVIAIQLANEPLHCEISGYFFEHALRSFCKALRSLQWKLGGEATLVSFDEELVLIVVRGHRGSANVCMKLVHGAEARTFIGSIDAEREDAERVVLDSGFIRIDAGLVGLIAEQVEEFLREPTLQLSQEP